VLLTKYLYLFIYTHNGDGTFQNQAVSQLHKSKYIEVESSTYQQRFPLCSSFRTTFVKQRFFLPSCFPPIWQRHTSQKYKSVNDKNTTTRSKWHRRGQCYQLDAELKRRLFPSLTIYHIPKPRLGMHEEIIPLLPTDKHFYGMMLNYAQDKLMLFSFIIAYFKTTVMSLPQMCLVARRCH